LGDWVFCTRSSQTPRSTHRKGDPDYPQTLTYPTESFASNAELRVAGLTLQTADFGPGGSATATVYFASVRDLGALTPAEGP